MAPLKYHLFENIVENGDRQAFTNTGTLILKKIQKFALYGLVSFDTLTNSGDPYADGVFKQKDIKLICSDIEILQQTPNFVTFS